MAVTGAIVGLSIASGSYSDLAVGVTTAVIWMLVLAALLGGRWGATEVRRPLALAAVALAALACFTAFSLLWSSDDGAGFAAAVRIAGYLGAFVFFGFTLRPGRAPATLAAVAVGIVIVSLIALGSRLGGIGSGDSELISVLPAATGRLSYPVGYWNALGALMALAIPVLVRIAAEAPRPRVRSRALAAISAPLLTAYMTSSRGALLAAGLGSAVVICFAADRRRSGAVLAVGIAGALPAIGAATVQSGFIDSAGTGSPGRAEIVVALSLLAGAALVGGWGERLVGALARPRFRRSRLRTALLVGAALAILVGVVVASGPSRLIDDFRDQPDRTASAGILSTSGSGHAQFWGTALTAFADAPLKGIGAGGYPSYWNRNGSLGTPTRNAHSEPLELLAELGVIGCACFLGFMALAVVAGVREARGKRGVEASAALGLVAAACVGFLIDWTWQVPAVVVPVLIATALMTGSALGAETSRPGSRLGSSLWGAPPLRLPGPARAVLLVPFAVAAIWAGGVLAVASFQLGESSRALERGEYDQAAQAARSAAAVEPWAAEPWLQLAAVEQSVGNLDAATGDAEAAIDRSPEDFRPWFLAASLRLEQGDLKAGAAYTLRAVLLAPYVLARGTDVLSFGSGGGA